MKTLNHFQLFVQNLQTQLTEVCQRQELEHKQLVELRDTLKGSMMSYKEVDRDILILLDRGAPDGFSGCCLPELIFHHISLKLW